jgi:hypothetical protein
MFFIYGSRGEITEISSGQFFCPQCATFTVYQLKQARRYATLFFVSAFPTGAGTRFVECGRCGSQFREEVLDYEPPTESERILFQAHKQLLAGTSIGKVQAMLEELGHDPSQAEAELLALCEGQTKRCGCGRRYHPHVLECADCGLAL